MDGVFDRQRGFGRFLGTSRFAIVRQLGVGGMGVVYEAFDRQLELPVALKTLTTCSPDGLFRFKREFRQFQDLHHPNLVRLHELHFDEGVWFFTMELVEGLDFLTWVRPAQRIDYGRLRDGLVQLARALVALHDAGKVHRDIKPSNIIVARTGRVVLLDFGIATDALRRSTDAVLGTIAYMAPEQAFGEAVDRAADWYAVGVLLYEALTGQLPTSGSLYAVLVNKSSAAKHHPRTLAIDTPVDLDELCVRLLSAEPGERPSGREVMQQLVSAASPPERSFHFVGRSRELKSLRNEYARSTTAFRGVVVVGQSGIGKSELVRQFVRDLQACESGCLVLSGSCHEREQVPYQAIDGMIDTLSTFLRKTSPDDLVDLLPARVSLLAQAFPVLERVDAIAVAPSVGDLAPDLRERRILLFSVFRELLVRLCAQHRLVLVIDDVHWIDADSAALLERVLREPQAPQLLLLAASRPEGIETAPFFQRLEHLALEPLEPDDARALAEQLRGIDEEAPFDPELIAREAAGHPLFIDVMVRHAAARLDGSAGVEAALAWEIELLPPDVRSVLQLACIAGRPMTREVAAHAATLTPEAVERCTRDLCVMHLLRLSSGTGFEPYHARVCSAALSKLDVAAARQLHARFAAALEATAHDDPEALARHFMESDQAERAVGYAEVAARKAADALAFERAAFWYSCCIERHPAPPWQLWADLGDSLANAGRGAQAGKAFARAAELAPAAQALQLRRRAAEQLLRSGQVDQGLEVLESVLSSVDLALPPNPTSAFRGLLFTRAQLRLRGLRFSERIRDRADPLVLERIDTCWAVASGLASIDIILASHFQALQLLMALRAGDLPRIVRGLSAEAGFVSVAGSRTRQRTTQLLARARELLVRVEQPDAVGLVELAEGVAGYLQTRWREGQESCWKAESTFLERCTGVAWQVDTARWFGLRASLWLGDIATLQRRVPEVLADAEARGDPFSAANVRTYLTPFLALCDDAPRRARTEIEAGMTRLSRKAFHAQHMNAELMLVTTDLYEGQSAAALARIDQASLALQRSRLSAHQVLRIWTSYTRGCVALALGDAAGALDAARRVEGESNAASHALSAMLKAGATPVVRSAAAWESAAQVATAADLHLHAACAQLHAGDPRGDAWMRAAGVRNPTKLARALAPRVCSAGA